MFTDLNDLPPSTFREDEERWLARDEDLRASQASLRGRLAELSAKRETLAKKDLAELVADHANPAQTEL